MKSLAKYFIKLKVTDGKESFKETVKYLENNGFVCYKDTVPYLTRNKYLKKGIINVAKQKATGKTIAFQIDRQRPRGNALQKLEDYAADYKIVLLRDSREHCFDNDIEIIPVKTKTMDEIIAEKEQQFKDIQAKQLSNTSKFKNDDERKLYDLAYEYMLYIYEEYKIIPKYKGLLNKMEEQHSALFNIMDKTKISSVLRQVHKEWRDIIYG